MLRKDVKLGFAIGGVMLAVVVVYVLVVPNTDKRGAQLVTDESASTQTPANSASSNNSSPNSANSSTPTANAPAGESATGNAAETSSDNVGDKEISAAPTTAPAVAVNNGNVWDDALKNGTLPPTMSTTPTAKAADAGSTSSAKKSNSSAISGDASSDASPVDPPADQPVNIPGNVSVATNDADARQAAGGGVGSTDPDASLASNTVSPSQTTAARSDLRPGMVNATGTSSTADTTHTVKAGETLSSIAAEAYGQSSEWKRIAEANPGINPNRLSAGTKLVLPPADQTAAQSHPGMHGGPANGGAIDPQTRYQVQANDSLYRISVRLYGNPEHVQKLYDDNKGIIGADPRHLKTGMILQLSTPPTASSGTLSARAS